MIKQGTKEWLAKKLGAITGTRAKELMSSNATRLTLMAHMLNELVDQHKRSTYKSPSMIRGNEIENEEIAVYEQMTGNSVTDRDIYIEVDFSPYVGLSPDGLIGDDGGFEGKRLDEHNHIKILLGGAIDKAYYWQCQWGMYITGRDWWDLFHYCETLPHSMQGHIMRYERDSEVMEKIDSTLKAFLKQYQSSIDKFEIGFDFNKVA